MRKLFRAGAIALALCVTLAGCAELQKLDNAFQAATGAFVTPAAVDIAINSYDAIEATAISYVKLPRCGTGPSICRDPAITAKVITLIRAGRADRNQLKAALRASPATNLSLVDVYNDLGSTTSALTALFVAK